MKLEDAIDRSILAYLDGEEYKEYGKQSDKPFKYNKKFFDDMDEKVLPPERLSNRKKKEEKKNG